MNFWKQEQDQSIIQRHTEQSKTRRKNKHKMRSQMESIRGNRSLHNATDPGHQKRSERRLRKEGNTTTNGKQTRVQVTRENGTPKGHR